MIVCFFKKYLDFNDTLTNNYIDKWKKIVINIKKFNLIKEKNEDNPFIIKLLDNKKSFNYIIEKIKAGDHPLLWTKIVFPKKILPYKLVIINLSVIWNSQTNSLISDTVIFQKMIKYCRENNILYSIVGDVKPHIFLEKIDGLFPGYFTLFNYFSKYHYGVSFMGHPYRLEPGKINNTPSSINIDILLDDIINEYKINRKDMLYIGEDFYISFPQSIKKNLEEKDLLTYNYIDKID